MNIITQIVFEVNHTATYEASFKAKKIMLPSLKCQIFHFLSKFALFTQCLDNKYNFPKSIYLHAKIKKIH